MIEHACFRLLLICSLFSVAVTWAEEPEQVQHEQPTNQPSSRLEEDMGILDNISGHGRFLRSVNPAGITPTITYSGWWAPQGTSGESNQNSLSVSAPVYKSQDNLIALNAQASEFHMASPPQLPASSTQTPSDLGRVEVGSHFTHKLNDISSAGGGLGFGSASDRPFAGLNVDTYNIDGFYSLSTSERSTWVVSLLYSNNNPIDNLIPVPGFMYIYHTPHFVARLGYPFASIYWQPVEPWTVSLSVFGPTANGEVAYGHRRDVQGFMGFRFLEQSYLRVDRTSNSDRLREDEKRAFMGLRFPVLSELICELQSGYAFDRFIGAGGGSHSLRFSSLDNSADLGNSWYLASTLRMGF